MFSQKLHENYLQTLISQSTYHSTNLMNKSSQAKVIGQIQSKTVMDEARQQLNKLQSSRNNRHLKGQLRQQESVIQLWQQAGQKQIGEDGMSNMEIARTNQFKIVHQKLNFIEMKMQELRLNLQRKKQSCSANNQLQLSALVTQEIEKTGLHYSNNHHSTQRSIYYISELVRAYQDERSLAREHINSTLSILKMMDISKKSTDQQIKKREVNLPRRAGYQTKKTLVFDLDQTLVHCNYSQTALCDVRLPIKTSTGEVVEAGINVRPYAKQILTALSKYFEIVIFTASHSSYANVVIDFLDDKKELVHHRLFREHCLATGQGMFIKDLRVIDRALKDIVLVDNAAYSYMYQVQNAVPILPYYQGQEDGQLVRLQEYLMGLCELDDVRQAISDRFKLHLYGNYWDRPQELVEQLYMAK